jgi:nucleoside-diphosphate-sugar epimerase
MRSLFTTASSFIGYRLVHKLVAAGHEVAAACRSDARCEGLRTKRVHREAANTPTDSTSVPRPNSRAAGAHQYHLLDAEESGWSEAQAWEEFVEFLGATNVF